MTWNARCIILFNRAWNMEIKVPDLSLETACNGRVAGLDEVGRGPLAGPVVAAAALFPGLAVPDDLLSALDDSKKLSEKQRLALYPRIITTAQIGIGAASVAEIDQLNILQASLLAMRRALAALPSDADYALVDGNRDPGLKIPTRLVVKGDGKSVSIAAASIVAKVVRDRGMEKLARRYPYFGWERNAGYGTQQHRDALARRGATAHHRRSFKPVQRVLDDHCAGENLHELPNAIKSA